MYSNPDTGVKFVLICKIFLAGCTALPGNIQPLTVKDVSAETLVG